LAVKLGTQSGRFADTERTRDARYHLLNFSKWCVSAPVTRWRTRHGVAAIDEYVTYSDHLRVYSYPTSQHAVFDSSR
jgi:hypothetical protein